MATPLCRLVLLLVLLATPGQGDVPAAPDREALAAELLGATSDAHCHKGGTAPLSGGPTARALAELWRSIGRPTYRRFYQASVATAAAAKAAAGAPETPSANVTLLLTFPNSGTTWTRRVFERVTNISSEAIYAEGRRGPIPHHYRTAWGTFVPPRGLVDLDSVHVRRPGQVTLLKAHQARGSLTRFQPRHVVRLHREPLEQALSNAHHRHARHPVNAAVIYLREYVRWHCNIVRLQAEFGFDVLTVTYDALLQRPARSFEAILSFVDGHGVVGSAALAGTVREAVVVERPAYTPAWFAVDPATGAWATDRGPAGMPSAVARSGHCGFSIEALALFFRTLDKEVAEYCPWADGAPSFDRPPTVPAELRSTAAPSSPRSARAMTVVAEEELALYWPPEAPASQPRGL